MAKKNKNQKRKAKLKARSQKRTIETNIFNSVRIDEEKIKRIFPNVVERQHYIRSLIADMDKKLESA